MMSNKNASLKRKQNIQKKIINILKTYGQVSNNNYNSLEVPFFMQNSNNQKLEINFNNNNNFNLNLLPNKLNRNIKFIYSLLKDPSCEIYIKEWTFFSPNKALELYNNYCKKGQKNVFDIGHKYMGMGHVEVISCDLETNLLFIRSDGGSNGYDRINNYNNLINKGTIPYKNNEMFFSDWFFKIVK